MFLADTCWFNFIFFLIYNICRNFERQTYPAQQLLGWLIKDPLTQKLSVLTSIPGPLVFTETCYGAVHRSLPRAHIQTHHFPGWLSHLTMRRDSETNVTFLNINCKSQDAIQTELKQSLKEKLGVLKYYTMRLFICVLVNYISYSK